MALLKFNEQYLTLTVEAGAGENYKPSKKVQGIIKKIDSLKEKVKVEQDRARKEYEEFLAAEITGPIKEIAKAIDGINRESYPELDQLKAKAREATKPAA